MTDELVLSPATVDGEVDMQLPILDSLILSCIDMCCDTAFHGELVEPSACPSTGSGRAGDYYGALLRNKVLGDVIIVSLKLMLNMAYLSSVGK